MAILIQIYNNKWQMRDIYVLIHINNSRRAVYGYDQRVEVFGSKGMVISDNQTPTSLERYSSTSTNEKELIHFLFIGMF